jgi:hypothetical protein
MSSRPCSITSINSPCVGSSSQLGGTGLLSNDLRILSPPYSFEYDFESQSFIARKNIVANPIHIGADVGRTVVIGISIVIKKSINNSVSKEDNPSPESKALYLFSLCGGTLSPPISSFL